MTTCLWISQNEVWQIFRLLSAQWQLYDVEEVRNKPKTGFCRCPAIKQTKVFFRIPSLSVKFCVTSFLPSSYEFLIFHQLCLQNTKYWRKRNKNSRNHPKSVSIVSLFHYCVIIICVMLIIDILEWNPEVLEFYFATRFEWDLLLSVQRAHVLTMLAKWVFGSDGVPKD